MPKLENVIKGIEDRIADAEYIDDGYYAEYVAVELLQAALALLKEQVPRVMTLEEANKALKEADFIVIELSDNKVMLGMRMVECFELSNGEYMDFDDLDDPEYRDEYGKQFRFWSTKPTEDQRKVVAWDDPENT